MAAFKAWATQQLTHLSLWLTKALGLDFGLVKPTPCRDTWTPESLASFGLEMSKGFGPGQ